jgi:IS30 family transposase
MMYRQITSAERYTLVALRRLGLTQAAMARHLGRHPSTIARELQRNRDPWDGYYRPDNAQLRMVTRRSHSRRNRRFSDQDLQQVDRYLCQDWSPEQVAGYLRRTGQLSISHETIYQYIWTDKRQGGHLYTHLRGARKQRWKRYRSYDSRGRLPGKRAITERPASVETRRQLGHWEIDTMLGDGSHDCLMSLVERKTGYVVLGKLPARTTAALNRRTIALIRTQPRRVRTITADNGTEFHRYPQIERATGARFYFATPHHAWERGTNENTNGLIRQYVPKGQSMSQLTQHQCDAIARKLNQRPRKRLGYRTPEECYEP